MKITGPVRIVWVDDDVEGRTKDAKNLMFKEKKLRVSVVHPSNFDEYFETKTLSAPDDVDLFLIDYKLNEVGLDDEQKYPKLGLTIAGTIREKLPDHPIYATSAGTATSIVPENAISAAEAVFDRIVSTKAIINNEKRVLLLDALYFKRIKNVRRNDVEALLGLLMPPHESIAQLKLILPSELRDGLGESGNSTRNAVSFARWTTRTLLQIPGFLYDRLHAATYLGTTAESLRRNEMKLKAARYEGVFSETAQPLWWRQGLERVVYSSRKISQTGVMSSTRLGPMVLEIKRGFSRCAVCGARYPETVASRSSDVEDLRAVHIRCSWPDPKMKNELFFDEYRAFGLKTDLPEG